MNTCVFHLISISKIIEKTILMQLQLHIINNLNYSKYQSAHRPHLFTETAIKHILGETFSAFNLKILTMCTGLDIFAAFDTFIYEISIEKLNEEFGVKDFALKWISSYLSDRKKFFKMGNSSFFITSTSHGILQGSELNPLFSTSYISPVGNLIANSNFQNHQYVDDNINI